ncbi:hypothetical protein Hanom_Chr10g00907681 [Helianthus anomalus]
MNIYLTLSPEFPVKTTPFSFLKPPHASNRHRSTTDILIYAHLLQRTRCESIELSLT